MTLNQKGLQTRQVSPRGTKLPPGENHWSRVKIIKMYHPNNIELSNCRVWNTPWYLLPPANSVPSVWHLLSLSCPAFHHLASLYCSPTPGPVPPPNLPQPPKAATAERCCNSRKMLPRVQASYVHSVTLRLSLCTPERNLELLEGRIPALITFQILSSQHHGLGLNKEMQERNTDT